jgi:endonuclease/exonuclease/phosphatase family metal-dependent hydrolase
MGSRRKRSPWPLALLFRLTVVTAAVALVMSYISVYINPSSTSIPLYFGLYFIPLVFINLFVLLLGILRRSGAVWITFVALLPSVLFAELFVRWGDVNVSTEGEPLKICTYNVGTFTQGQKKERDFNIQGISKFIKEEDPHVVCFQEFYIKDTSEIEGILRQYPHRYYHLFGTKSSRQFGNITYSKYPITNQGKLVFKGSTNLCIYTDVQFRNKTLRIYNTHLESHSISFTALVKKMRESRNVTDEIYEVHDRMAGTFRKRAQQVDSIVAHSSNSSHPAIICGDLNDTPMSYTYNKLTNDKKDSFRQSGKGFSATYSLFWPLLRIDYILYPSPIWSLSHKTPRIRFSDHYPVVTELIIP